MRALSSTVLQPSILALQYRSLSTSPILQDTRSSSKSTASFTRAKTAEPISSNSSSTSTTAQSSGNAPARTGYNAVAKAESKLAKQQKGMSRQMPGMSLENQDQPLADPYILPPLHQVGIMRVGGIMPSIKYIFARLRRYFRLRLTAMSTIVQKEPMIASIYTSPEFTNLPWYKRFIRNLNRITPTASIQPLSNHLADVWEQWNKAQASGDVNTIRQISVSQALEIAKNRAQHQIGGGTVMTWNVDRYITKPKAIDARVLQVDSTGQTTLAQVIVKLETDQTLTIKPRSRAPQTLRSTATEYYAFEKLLSNAEARWKIKQKLKPYSGGELPKDLM
ncbi:hypothetical protein QFC24_001000 [Naganishia onofrii]|uniref:Uncharacterized protein n=1 Tax=Naganishia onofrii TaxID=1851511 RepID=A0ACC2XW55_9TREE|nr:hypothetical protein QFC24_001000 [Naganishia onofrii]